jgi:dTDP-4-amino-4,6-dideoxygalactose transaminase
MSAILCDIKPGDEVIVPSYSFVSCANAFVLRGAKIVFADSEALTPNIDVSLLEGLITSRTKAILVIHYAGIACDMNGILSLARKYGLKVIEDAAHAIDSYFEDKPLGSFGDLATFSFHETKNVTCGEGGLLVINNKSMAKRAEIIWEKGTNRVAFSKGEVQKYEWVDVGSSFLPSELSAAYLYAQLEVIDSIQKHRVSLWDAYNESFSGLKEHGVVKLPSIPPHCTNNGHIFYLVCSNKKERDSLINVLLEDRIHPTFHYLPLHLSPYYGPQHDGRSLPNAERFSDCLVRLPLHYRMNFEDVGYVTTYVKNFFSTS